jgi:PAS domain S-box-containing protein
MSKRPDRTLTTLHETLFSWLEFFALDSDEKQSARPAKTNNTTRGYVTQELMPTYGTGLARDVWVIMGLLTLLTAAVVVIGLVHPRLFLERHFFPGALEIDLGVVTLGLILMLEIMLIFSVVAQNNRRHLAERLLRESEDRMVIAAEAANLGLWRWDVQRDRIWLTRHGRQLLGISPSLTLTMSMLDESVHPDDRAMVHDMINAVLLTKAGDKDVYEVEYRLLTADDQLRWVRTRTRARRRPDGKVVELAGTVLDVTESKQMRAEVEKQRITLAHLSRISVLGELSGALAHELKQPLTAIMSNAQAAQRLLDHDPIDFSELRNAIADIVEDDTRAGDVITHLRALLKNDDVHHQEIDLNAVILSALDLVQSDLIARRVNIVKSLSDERMIVIGDSVQLQQLVLNLALNAAEAMSGEAGGMVLIATDRSDDGSTHLSVSDTGTGIKPEFLSKIFEPLVSTKPQGLGLGLSICRAIAEAHGGSIWAANNPGRGATFHALFPALTEDRK